MKTRIRILNSIYSSLREHHLDPDFPYERLSYIFGTSYVGRDGIRRILVCEPPILLDDDCYVRQHGGQVALHEDVRDAIWARFARSDHDTIIDVHDHWFSPGGTSFSSVDDRDDIARARYLYGPFARMLRRQPEIGRSRPLHTVSLVLDRSGLDARTIDRSGSFETVERIDVIGEHALRVIPNSSQPSRILTSDTSRRHEDFITHDQQRFLADTVFGIVGCGGLGSIMAEALLRLGARRFILFDDDMLELHNLNRWQGGRLRDVGRNKAVLLARRLRRLGEPGETKAMAVQLSVLSPGAESALSSCDVLIGCLDNALARSFLNRVAIQFLLPSFDAGVNIRTKDRIDFEDRFYAVFPGASACAECTAYELFDQSEVSAALMDDMTAAAKRGAGYVEQRAEIRGAASAYALNMRAVSVLVLELTNWVCDFRSVATCVFERWQSGNFQRSDRSNHPERPSPGCTLCSSLLGVADQVPLPRPRLSGETQQALLQAKRESQRMAKRRLMVETTT